MKRRKLVKRAVSGLLALLLCVGLMPVKVKAAGDEGVVQLQVQQMTEPTLIPGEEGVYNGLYDIEGNSMARAVMLTNCTITMAYRDNGTRLHMEFSTSCTHTASEIGIADITVEHKVGIFSPVVATAAGGCSYNTSSCGAECNYYGVVVGDKYRVSCTHYAWVDDVYYSASNQTDWH